MTMSMARTTMFLPEDLRRRLADEARRRGQPQAVLVREALEGYLDRAKAKRSLPTFVGSASSGEVDARDAKRWVREEWDKKRGRREAERRRDSGS